MSNILVNVEVEADVEIELRLMLMSRRLMYVGWCWTMQLLPARISNLKYLQKVQLLNKHSTYKH